MDGVTLMSVMGSEYGYAVMSLSRYTALAPRWDLAMRQAGCTTPDRVAMACGQLAAESGGLRWTEEFASGAEYEWRADLGNTHAGDGRNFKGRSFIQITGRNNYARLSKWAHSKGYVPTPTFFVDHPEKLAEDQYIFLGFVWYWTVARPQMNRLADSLDIVGATRAVNGGTNNLAGRKKVWQFALRQGGHLLPAAAPKPVVTTKEVEMATICTVNYAECKKRKIAWPGIWLSDGREYGHILTPAEVTAYRHLGHADKTISVADHAALYAASRGK